MTEDLSGEVLQINDPEQEQVFIYLYFFFSKHFVVL